VKFVHMLKVSLGIKFHKNRLQRQGVVQDIVNIESMSHAG